MDDGRRATGPGLRPPIRSDGATDWGTPATVVLLGSVAAVVALHRLRPDLGPLGHRVSEYAVGPWGWVMTAAFFGLAVGVWMVRRGLAPSPSTPDDHVVLRTLLAVAAAGLVASALFETDPAAMGAPAELVHSVASSAAIVALVLAAVWTSTIGRRTFAWPGTRWAADAAAGLAAVGLVLGPVTHDGLWTGAVQRGSYLAIVAWLVMLARAAAPRPRPDASADR